MGFKTWDAKGKGVSVFHTIIDGATKNKDDEFKYLIRTKYAEIEQDDLFKIRKWMLMELYSSERKQD